MIFVKRCCSAIIVIIYLSVGVCSAQEKGLLLSTYYSSKDYNAGTQNWAIAKDNRGVMYFGNISGVLEFDGESWRLIKVSNESIARSLSVNSNGVVFVGAYNELGYLAPNEIGQMNYKSLTPIINQEFQNFGEVWDITCFSDTVYFLTDKFLFQYVDNEFLCWESEKNNYYLSHKVNNRYLVQELGKGLLELKDNSLQQIDNGNFFSDIRVHSIFPINEGLLICTRTDGFFVYNNQAGKASIKPFSNISANAKKLNQYFVEHSFYHGIKVYNNHIALSSITGNILIVNPDWEVVDVICQKTMGIKSPTLYLHYEKDNPLWLALDNGICKVELVTPFRFWNQDTGIDGVITDISRFNNKLYISTASGILHTDNTKSNEFEVSHFTKVKGKFEQAWQFQYFTLPSNEKIEHETDTLLFCATRTGLYQITDDTSVKVSNYSGLNCLHQSKKDPSKLLVGLNNGIAVLEYVKGNWIDQGLKYGIDDKISSIGEDSLGNIWACSNYKGVFRIPEPFSQQFDINKVEIYDTLHGLPSIKTIKSFSDNDFLIYTDYRYFSFSETEKRFIEDFSTYDSDTNIDSLYLNRVWDDIISNFYVTHANDTNFWFSTNDGIFRYSNLGKRNYHELPSAIIRTVLSGDSILFQGTNTKLKNPKKITNDIKVVTDPSPVIDLKTMLNYKDNSLTFYFSFPYFEGDKSNLYSYKLVGFDNNWHEWSPETKKEYTNLREGNYSFMVKAKNIYGIESTSTEFKFAILPPWYRTLIAYIWYVMFGIVVILLSVKFYTHRLIIEKDKLEILVKERTQEILIQKEEIMVQAEHLKDANDWITAKNQELEKQKNLLEKSNTTKNKFFRIIAHDLRNPISTLVSSTGYLLTDIDDFNKEKTKHFIGELNRLSLITYNLLENLLDWSSNEMGDIKFAPKIVDLNTLINENIELVRSKLNSKNISLTIDLHQPILVFADENMLNTVVRNLITNAVKFTRDNGSIKIISTVENDFYHLSILDNGIGISDENMKQLFKIDKDVRSYGTHNEKGSGLGLNLSKEFIERNGGKISVESTYGEGSIFTISIKQA